MRYTDDELDRIYSRTRGKCHICHGQLARINYGLGQAKGTWEVEHSVPRSKGGADHLNNLFPAHITCNRDKSNRTTRTARRWNGKTRAPLSPEKYAKARVENTALGTAIGIITGLALGPGAWILCGLAGACIGHDLNPDKTG